MPPMSPGFQRWSAMACISETSPMLRSEHETSATPDRSMYSGSPSCETATTAHVGGLRPSVCILSATRLRAVQCQHRLPVSSAPALALLALLAIASTGCLPAPISLGGRSYYNPQARDNPIVVLPVAATLEGLTDGTPRDPEAFGGMAVSRRAEDVCLAVLSQRGYAARLLAGRGDAVVAEEWVRLSVALARSRPPQWAVDAIGGLCGDNRLLLVHHVRAKAGKDGIAEASVGVHRRHRPKSTARSAIAPYPPTPPVKGMRTTPRFRGRAWIQDTESGRAVASNRWEVNHDQGSRMKMHNKSPKLDLVRRRRCVPSPLAVAFFNLVLAI